MRLVQQQLSGSEGHQETRARGDERSNTVVEDNGRKSPTRPPRGDEGGMWQWREGGGGSDEDEREGQGMGWEEVQEGSISPSANEKTHLHIDLTSPSAESRAEPTPWPIDAVRGSDRSHATPPPPHHRITPPLWCRSSILYFSPLSSIQPAQISLSLLYIMTTETPSPPAATVQSLSAQQAHPHTLTSPTLTVFDLSTHCASLSSIWPFLLSCQSVVECQ